AVVEQVTADAIVVIGYPGMLVHQHGDVNVAKQIWRVHFWADRPHIISEVFTAERQRHMVYVDIASHPTWDDRGLRYHDYELDVVKPPDGPAYAVDQDEFAEAIVQYSYTEEHQATCWAALESALVLAEAWQWGAPPGPPPADLPLHVPGETLPTPQNAPA
ncbi:MAG: DUF402 domain-containing protein, partial [Chloroflexi bacterium]|nr:DUF402 domain-containing protein [Chloroflexota bacterium]